MKLFNRNFTMMVVGQVISLFGNSILRFALSLSVLDATGSAAAFGSILALSMVPVILLSPIGGMIADRVNRRNIMVVLDFTTSALIFVFAVLHTSSVVLIGVFMVLLAVIQSFYQPSVQSSIPLLQDKENLMQANGIVTQVNAMANLLGPILGGMLYGYFGLMPIVLVSGVCFFLSAVLELFIRIPFTRRARSGGILATAGQDLKAGMHFILKDHPVLLKLLLIVAGINFFLSALMTVGLPYLIKITLGLSSQMYSFVEAGLAAGTIIGALCVGLVSKKIPMQKSYVYIMFSSLLLVPIALAVVSTAQPYISYAVILLCTVGSMVFGCFFNIYAQSFLQEQTPTDLLGKVMAFVSVLSMCAMPIGQAFYGFLFDFVPAVFVIPAGAAVICLLLALTTRRSLHALVTAPSVSAEE